MNIRVSGKHMDITDPIRAYAEQKASAFPKFFDGVSTVEVVTQKPEGHDYEVEFIVHVDGHDHFVARGHHRDLYASIDAASNKIERQLTDHKDKLRSHKHPH